MPDAWHYDAYAGVLATGCRLTHTIVLEVFRQPEFWGFLMLHLAVCWAFRSGYLEGADEKGSPLFLDERTTKLIVASTTFFEIFYTNQCFKRYTELYDISRQLLGSIYDFAFEVRLHLRDGAEGHARVAARWFTASVILFFYERNSVVSAREWSQLLKHGLLKQSEKEFLSGFQGHQRSLVLLQWSAMACLDGCKKVQATPITVKSLVDRLLAARMKEQTVIDTMNLPIPYPYFHLLNFMVVVNLMLWAYSMGTTASAFGPVTFFFVSLIFLGMLELASALSDPFGTDEVDFPVSDWMNSFLEHTIVFLEFECPAGMVGSALKREKRLSPEKRDIRLFLEENFARAQAPGPGRAAPPSASGRPFLHARSDSRRGTVADDEGEGEGGGDAGGGAGGEGGDGAGGGAAGGDGDGGGDGD